MRSWKSILVIYDIEETKARNKVVQILEAYGRRVQKSAFECYVDDGRLTGLFVKLKRYVGEADSIRVYYSNRTCFDVGTGADVQCYSSEIVIA